MKQVALVFLILIKLVYSLYICMVPISYCGLVNPYAPGWSTYIHPQL